MFSIISSACCISRCTRSDRSYLVDIVDFNFLENQAYQQIANGYEQRISAYNRYYNQQNVHNITIYFKPQKNDAILFRLTKSRFFKFLVLIVSKKFHNQPLFSTEKSNSVNQALALLFHFPKPKNK